VVSLYKNKILLYCLIGFGLIQFIQTDKSVVEYDKSKEIQANANVMKILKTSCYDCHSYETIWPDYSYVAPISWVVSSNVSSGRSALNFSLWSDIDEKIKLARLKRTKKLITNSMMPKSDYIIMHQEALLSDADKKVLREFLLNKIILKIFDIIQ
jgi:hypothetical protein